MKKLFFVASLCMVVTGLFADLSIKDVIKRFDEKLERNSIPKVQVVIGSIHFGETETHGSAVSWMKREIEKAAGKVRRITVIRETLNTVRNEVKTRGMPTQKKVKSSAKKKYTISGTYLENKAKGIVTLTLSLEVFDDEKTEVFATETATIPSSEFTDNGLTLYPENINQAQSVDQVFKVSKDMLESDASSVDNTEKMEAKDSAIKEEVEKSEDSSVPDKMSSSFKKESNEARSSAKKEIKEGSVKRSQSVQITAYMLNDKNEVVDILRPGDVVKFLVGVDKDVYIKIMGIDANGNTFWLPTNDDFIKANTVREFPDDNTVDYQVVDGVFGAEHLFIYASTSREGLPAETGESKYHPSLIKNTTRGITAVKKKKDLITGVFKIAYVIVP